LKFRPKLRFGRNFQKERRIKKVYAIPTMAPSKTEKKIAPKRVAAKKAEKKIKAILTEEEIDPTYVPSDDVPSDVPSDGGSSSDDAPSDGSSASDGTSSDSAKKTRDLDFSTRTGLAWVESYTEKSSAIIKSEEDVDADGTYDTEHISELGARQYAKFRGGLSGWLVSKTLANHGTIRNYILTGERPDEQQTPTGVVYDTEYFPEFDVTLIKDYRPTQASESKSMVVIKGRLGAARSAVEIPREVQEKFTKSFGMHMLPKLKDQTLAPNGFCLITSKGKAPALMDYLRTGTAPEATKVTFTDLQVKKKINKEVEALLPEIFGTVMKMAGDGQFDEETVKAALVEIAKKYKCQAAVEKAMASVGADE